MDNNVANMPLHIAMIMDGNGRWAKKRLLPRNLGHKKGVDNLIKVVRHCSDIGIKCLTLFAFSTENWSRPQEEVEYLMNLLRNNLVNIEKKLQKRNIKIKIIGQKERIPEDVLTSIQKIEQTTINNLGMILNIAFNYGSQDEIVYAVKETINNNEQITKENIEKHLYTNGCPNVDLLIRTSGEYRISNFLLWQIAYSELYFTNTYWPDFTPKQVDKAIKAYLERDRRFGGIKEK